MKIKRFNESISDEVSDYVLELIESDGFVYEPSGSIVKITYKGKPKDSIDILRKYNVAAKRYDDTYGVTSKSIVFRDQDGEQSIDITFNLKNVDDFKIEFTAFDRKLTGDVISYKLHGYNTGGDTYVNPIGLAGFGVSLTNLTNFPRRSLLLEFTSGEWRPLINGCRHKRATLGSDGDSNLKIDTKNAQKILDIIKSGQVRGDREYGQQFMDLFNQITPEVLSK